jgi:hypothetical protein
MRPGSASTRYYEHRLTYRLPRCSEQWRTSARSLLLDVMWRPYLRGNRGRLHRLRRRKRLSGNEGTRLIFSSGPLRDVPSVKTRPA